MEHKRNLKSSGPVDRGLLFSLLILVFLAAPVFGQHIHELYYNNVDWTDTDLSAQAGGPVVYPQGIAAFYTTPNDQYHVYYASNGDYHVHQLFYNGSSWSDTDLTSLTGGAVASNSAGMSGFSIANAQYLYFCSSDFSLHEYSYGDGGNFNWVDRALPVGGYSGTCGFAPVGIVAYATTNNQRHVYYEAPYSASGRTIHHLYFNGSKWLRQNLTQLTKGEKAQGATWMSGFAKGNSQYVFFQGIDGHIHEYSDVTTWKDQDLTVLAGGVTATAFEGNGTAAFIVPGKTQMEVYYAGGTSAQLHRMTFKNNAWKDTNLTTLTGGPGPYSLSQIVGFATTPNDQLHVYLGGIGEDAVEQFFYNGKSWAAQQLPSAGLAGLGPGIAGFSLGNLQHVYYISAN